MVRRLALIAAGVLFLGFVSAAPAVAQGGPGYAPGASITLSTTVVCENEAVTVNGAHFSPNEMVTAVVNPVVGTAMVAPDGTFALIFHVPSLPAGTHTLTVRGTTGDLASAMFTLPTSCPEFAAPTAPVATAPAAPSAVPPSAVPPSAPSGLAFTGTEITVMAAAGAVLLVVGGMLVLATRKRRSASAS